MSARSNMAYELRQSQNPHYNCCQSVFIPFCDICGIDKEMAFKLGANFGGGMRVGSVCGAVTGGLMVLGMLGRSEQEVNSFMNDFLCNNGSLNCNELLTKVTVNCPKAQLCNGFVVECVLAIEKIISGNT